MRHIPNDPVFSDDEYENKILLHKPMFQDGVEAIRRKWDVPEEGFLNEKLYTVWQNKLAMEGIEQYEEDILLLIRKLELTDRWLEPISAYIQTNAPNVLRVRNYDPTKEDYDDDGKTIRAVWIKVDGDTTQREIIESFKDAQYRLGVPGSKKQKSEKLDRDLAVLEMHNDGKSNSEIAEWLNENAEGAFNTDDVAQILKRIKQRLD
jgi:hypothetical protein